MRNITNEHRDSQILNLGSADRPGPYLVTQTGCAPRAEIPKTHLYVLRPDGQWVDFNAYACQNKPEAMDEIVFASIAKVMQTFTSLRGPARVLDMAVDKAGLEKWLERQQGVHPLDAARAWGARYRERHSKRAGG